ncbi:MAG TPA: DUF2202 domain-containing protein [Acidimicrobiales bacterium]|nr:DUF2202 domain-containing protein [Acidimicrobiales bacterium]
MAAVSVAALLALAGCGSAPRTGTSSQTAGPAATAPSTAAPSTAAPTTVPTASVLTAAERAGLNLIHEQERAGLDAYAIFASRYPTQPVFANLASSQKTQLAAVTAVMARYGMADPSAGLAAGKYADPTVQQLYDSTVAAGTTADHALDAVEHFEQQHLASIQAARAATTRADLVTMYTNLEQASNSHITACSNAQHNGAQG